MNNKRKQAKAWRKRKYERINEIKKAAILLKEDNLYRIVYM